MSIKYFCDICKKETNQSERVKLEIVIDRETKLNVEITTGLNGSWNSGNFHHKCIANKIAEAFKK